MGRSAGYLRKAVIELTNDYVIYLIMAKMIM